MKRIRVLVVDDSAFMRKMLSDMLSSDKRIDVVGTARNGAICLEKIPKLKPDVITLDIEMPVMDGIETLEHIMEKNPVAVVMVSSISDEHTRKTIDAISKGAVDFVPKPSGPISLDIDLVKEEIINKVIIASGAKMTRVTKQAKARRIPPLIRPHREKKNIICLGSSTGGPRALEKILKRLPENFPAPILIVQHMPASFTKSLAKRLDQISEINVKEARDGEVIRTSQVYIAPGDFHMEVEKRGKDLTIALTKDEARRGHRPAVDVLLESITSLKDYNKIAIILTGMGQDGAKGIKQLKEIDSSAIVISESEESAVINGMPRAARETGQVNLTLHIDQISETVIKLLNN